MLFYGPDGAAAWQGFVQEKGQAIGRHSICGQSKKTVDECIRQA